MNSNKVDQKRDLFPLTFSILGIVLILFLTMPLLFLLTNISPLELINGLSQKELVSAIYISLISSFSSLSISTFLGVPLAYILARKEFFGKQLVEILVIMPLVIPPIVSGILLLMVYGPNTIIGIIAQKGNIEFTGTVYGIIIAQIFTSSPFLILSSKSAFQGVDEKLEQISLTLGKNPFETFLNVSLPLAKRGILTGMAMAWARAIGEFGATVVMAYHPHSLPVKIWVDFLGWGLTRALPVVVTLLIISIIAILGIRIISREPKVFKI